MASTPASIPASMSASIPVKKISKRVPLFPKRGDKPLPPLPPNRHILPSNDPLIPTKRTLFINGLPHKSRPRRKADLLAIFIDNTVRRVRLGRKGEAFVEFSCHSQALHALHNFFLYKEGIAPHANCTWAYDDYLSLPPQ